ncbi:Uncharacterised protein [uncultured Blautia sp.]|nr:Uncharacterised protein [uncultured Blautia sp.]
MIYKDFQDLKLSALGMGCMRLPVVGGNDAVVDEAAATTATQRLPWVRPWPNIPGKNFTLPTSSPVTTYPTCPRCRRFLRSS